MGVSLKSSQNSYLFLFIKFFLTTLFLMSSLFAFQSANAGSISGKVTDSSGVPIPNVSAYAYQKNGTGLKGGIGISGTSDSNGNYKIGGLPITDDYYLAFYDSSGNFVESQGYPAEVPFDFFHIGTKTPVKVTVGLETTGIDIKLVNAGSISGKVTDSSGVPIPNVSAYAYQKNGTGLKGGIGISGTSDSNGNYKIGGLPITDDYYLAFYDSSGNFVESQGYPAEVPFDFFHIGTKTPVKVTVGLETTGIDIFLFALGSDNIPDSFHFSDQINTQLSTQILSNSITITGINTPTTISIHSGEYEINGSGTWLTTNSTVQNNDTVRVRHTSSSLNSATVDTILTIGGISDTFSSTTITLVASIPTLSQWGIFLLILLMFFYSRSRDIS